MFFPTKKGPKYLAAHGVVGVNFIDPVFKTLANQVDKTYTNLMLQWADQAGGSVKRSATRLRNGGKISASVQVKKKAR